MYFQFLIEDQSSGALIDILMQKMQHPIKMFNIISNPFVESVASHQKTLLRKLKLVNF